MKNIQKLVLFLVFLFSSFFISYFFSHTLFFFFFNFPVSFLAFCKYRYSAPLFIFFSVLVIWWIVTAILLNGTTYHFGNSSTFSVFHGISMILLILFHRQLGAAFFFGGRVWFFFSKFPFLDLDWYELAVESFKVNIRWISSWVKY